LLEIGKKRDPTLHLALFQAVNFELNFYEDDVESKKIGTWVLCLICQIRFHGGCFLKLWTDREHFVALDLTIHPTLDPALHLTLNPTLDPTLGAHHSWRLAYWWALFGESNTWVLFMLKPSSYGTQHIRI
jgi:hypothetical protein